MEEQVDDKKIKRAAANVNERRRMQNINTGFEALRDLIDVPNKSKLSKVRYSIVQAWILYCRTSPVDECNFCITFSFKVHSSTGDVWQ